MVDEQIQNALEAIGGNDQIPEHVRQALKQRLEKVRNDRNTDAAPAWAIASLRIGLEQKFGPWVFREFARLNNFTNVNYVGSVIVGDTNGRYFEPSATRNFLIGVSAYASF